MVHILAAETVFRIYSGSNKKGVYNGPQFYEDKF
jgi:hypothetical protein